MKHAAKSFLLLLVLCAAIVGCKKTEKDDGNNNNNPNDTITVPKNEIGQGLNCNCNPADFQSAKVVFTKSIMKPEDISYIFSLGLMQKGHVTPIDHQYYFPPNITMGANAPDYPVYSPADGYIVRISRAPEQQVEQHLAPRDGYDILIQHSCEVYTYLQLTTGLTDEVSTALGSIDKGKTKDVKIAVKAGQQVARVGGQSLDLTVMDQNTPAKKWIVPTHYTEMGKRWKTDAFLYYTDEIKQPLVAKTIRTGEPFGGRFDYDEDGKLVGGWFLQGTNGYNGIASEGYDYWRGHLVFAYFTVNTSVVEVSIGRWNQPGASENDVKGGWQFAVKDNGPDPKDITVASGMVKYELMQPVYMRQSDNQPWGQQNFEGQLTVAGGTPKGIILVQMLESRLIKVEAFPGKTAAEVTGFTSNAQLYER